ncbi:hypothetical protein ACWD3J_12425 [Streptomyces sp. NPDC002755]|uniref:hypothetical protein n=1 Tax=Streptomyces sp. NPDC002884 TaxID=3154544 RepID=UPI0033284CA9
MPRDHHVRHAVRADLLRRPGRVTEAAAACVAALAPSESPAERAFLDRRGRALAGGAGEVPVRCR